jgi:hypothetical protein
MATLTPRLGYRLPILFDQPRDALAALLDIAFLYCHHEPLVKVPVRAVSARRLSRSTLIRFASSHMGFQKGFIQGFILALEFLDLLR